MARHDFSSVLQEVYRLVLASGSRALSLDHLTLIHS